MVFRRQKGLCRLPCKTSCLLFVRGAGVFLLTKFLVNCRLFLFEFSSGQYAGQRLSQFVVASSSVMTSKICIVLRSDKYLNSRSEKLR